MTVNDKVRENRLRRAAERQGLRLEKSKRRDPLALEYGTFQLVDAATTTTVACAFPNRGYGMTLDEIERELERGR